MERTLWSDERIDDAMTRIDRRFDEVDRRFDRLDDEIAALRNHVLQFLFVQTGLLLTIVATLIVQVS